MNARKLQQIQDFEEKALGAVMAHGFEQKLHKLEAQIAPLISFFQRAIKNPRLFGYNIFNKYTIAGAIGVYVC